MELYAKQFLRPESDIVETMESIEAIQLFLKEMTAFQSSGRLARWTVLGEPDSEYTFQVHIMPFHVNAYKPVTKLKSGSESLFRNGLTSGADVSLP